jgi:hypothetical protein
MPSVEAFMQATPSVIRKVRYSRMMEMTMHFPQALMKSRRTIDDRSAVKSEINDIFHDYLRSLTNWSKNDSPVVMYLFISYEMG